MHSQKYSHPYSVPDEQLIQAALAGDKKALEQLIKRHQDFIYNVSLRLFCDPDDALDATQEVLIKVITNLKSFEGKSRFRTWLYRIAFNHFLHSPHRKIEVRMQKDPESLSGFVAEDPLESVSEAEVEEVRLLCGTAMLLCLSREQRLIYIIGEIFGADHHLGAELFEVSPANFRLKLHRAKADLLAFASGKCGLINPANACRCPKKARFLIEKGIVDKDNLRFNTDYRQRVDDFVRTEMDGFGNRVRFELKELFEKSPFQVKQQLDQLVNQLVS